MIRQLLPPAVQRPVLLLSFAFAAYSGLAVWKEKSQFARIGDIPAGLEGALSLVIGLLLAFRVNRAFDRWWEGRTLWGTLVNSSRNLSVKIATLVSQRDDSVERFARLIAAYPYALRNHLRDDPRRPLPGLIDAPNDGRHLPTWIVAQMYHIIEEWKQVQRIQYGEFRMIDRETKVLLEVCGGCERIKNTPIAYSFRSFLVQALGLFLFTLPWGLVTDFGAWTILIVFLTSYFVCSAEAIAEHVEQPFEPDGDRLDLDSICKTIEKSVDELFANDVLPATQTATE